jgi:TfdA family taurine catabolism dioxygenase TauD
VNATCAALESAGFATVRGGFRTTDDAFATARKLIDARCAEHGAEPLGVIGDFVLPPEDGPPSRDFQTLHFDFGLPVLARVPRDVARYTALHVPHAARSASAVTRLVPLASLLGQREWPARRELLESLSAYGRTHGAWDDELGYTEGSLARIVEGACGGTPRLPSVKADPAFLCGLEFSAPREEIAFFADHALRIEEVEIEIALRPGQLLVFDNLALAHGRRGTRRPGELRQRVFGHHRLSPTAQERLRERVLDAFCVAPRASATVA